MRLQTIMMIAFVAVLSAACYGYGAPAAPGPAAPTSGGSKAGTPSLSIVSPAEGAAVSGGEVAVSVKVESFTIKGAGGPNQPNEGHLHMKVDGGAVTMFYGASHTLSGIPAGKHALEVELVNNDHSPLSPAVKKMVSFTVGSTASTAPTTPRGYGY